MKIGDLFLDLHVDTAVFKKDMASVGTIAAGALGLIGVAVAGIGLKAAMEWESAFAGVRKTVEGTEEELAALEQGIRNMASEIPLSVTELARLAEAAGALGIRTEDIEEFVRTAATLGVTTDVSADQAATALGKINAVIPLTRDEYSRFAATLVDLGNKGASTESQILDMAQNMAGVGATIGMSHQELLGWAAAAANAGMEAEAGSSSFQRLGLGVQKMVVDAGPKLEQIAQLTGMTGEAFAELWSTDSSEALRRIVAGLAEMDGTTRQATLAALGFTDIRLTRYLLALSANQDNLNQSLQVGVEAWDANTAHLTEAERRYATVESQLQFLRNELHDIAITIGEALLPHLRSFVGLTREIAGGIGNWMRENKGLAGTLTAVLTALSGLLALKFGTRFIGALLGQFGAGQLSSILMRQLSPQLVGAGGKLGTATGAAQGAAHAAAATSPGILKLLAVRIAAMAIPLAPAGTTVGSAVGAAMGLGLTAGLLGAAGAVVMAPLLLDKLGITGAETSWRASLGGQIIAAAVAKGFDQAAADELGAVALAAYDQALAGGASRDAAIRAGIEAAELHAAGFAVGAQQGPAKEHMAAAGAFLTAQMNAAAEKEAQKARIAEELAAQLNEGRPAVVDATGNVVGAVAGAIADGEGVVKRAISNVVGNFELMVVDIADAVRGNKDLVRDAMKDLMFAMNNPMRLQREVNRIEGALSGKKLAEGLASSNPWIRNQAIAARQILIDQWELLTGQSYNSGVASGKGLTGGVGSQKDEMKTTAGKVADSARTGFTEKPWFTWGSNAAAAWLAGLSQKIAGATRQVSNAMRGIRRELEGFSPPKGSLRNIDKWGANIGQAWVDGLVSAIAHAMLPMGGIAGQLQPAFAGPSFSAASAERMPTQRIDYEPGRDRPVVGELKVYGLPMQAETPLQVVEELRRAARMGINPPRVERWRLPSD